MNLIYTCSSEYNILTCSFGEDVLSSSACFTGAKIRVTLQLTFIYARKHFVLETEGSKPTTLIFRTNIFVRFVCAQFISDHLFPCWENKCMGLVRGFEGLIFGTEDDGV